MGAQLPMPGLSGGLVAGVGDELDRCYTPDRLALACVKRMPTRHVETAVEPSVGGGAFVRALCRVWPTASVLGVDVDPGAAGLALCADKRLGSWPKMCAAGDIPRPDIVVGNPPFSGDTALAHVEAALDLGAEAVGLILPWSYWGVERWTGLLYGRGVVSVSPIFPRPWPAQVREVAFYVWQRGYTGSAVDLSPLFWSAAGGGTPEQTKGPKRGQDASDPASNLSHRGST